MKQRSLPKMFGLFIITLGVYRLYWFAKTRREMMEKDDQVRIPTLWLLAVPYLLMFVAIVALAGALLTSAIDAHHHCESYGTSTPAYQNCVDAELDDPSALQIAGTAGVYLSALAFLPLTALWLWPYSKGVERITHSKLPFPMAMLVVVAVPDGVDMLIVQDSFNKLPQTATT